MAETAEAVIKTGKAELRPITQEQMKERIAKKAAKAEALVETPPAETKPIETKPVEPIAETKPTEEKPVEPKAAEETKPTKKSLKDIAKPFSNKKVAPVAEGELVIPDPVKEKLSTYEKENIEYKNLFNDPEVKTFLEARKAGKSVIDIFKEVISNTVDTKKMTDAQVYELGLKNNGVKPSSELDKDSEEPSLEDEMEKFRSMGKLAQKREADSIRTEIEKSNTGTTENFLNKLISHNEQSQAQQTAQKQEEIQKLTQLQKGINEWADAYSKGINHFAVVGDPKLAESIKNFKLVDLIFPTTEDGKTIDYEKVADLIHYSLTRDLRYENLENQAFANGFDELKTDVEVTKGSTMGIVRTPNSSKPKTEQELVKEAHSKMRPVSAGHASIRQ